MIDQSCRNLFKLELNARITIYEEEKTINCKKNNVKKQNWLVQ